MSDTFRESSKKNWIPATNSPPTDEQLKAGCLQRIADSLERIEKPYLSLLEDVERYKRWYREAEQRNEKYLRQIAGLKGYIKRLKKEKKP